MRFRHDGVLKIVVRRNFSLKGMADGTNGPKITRARRFGDDRTQGGSDTTNSDHSKFGLAQKISERVRRFEVRLGKNRVERKPLGDFHAKGLRQIKIPKTDHRVSILMEGCLLDHQARSPP